MFICDDCKHVFEHPFYDEYGDARCPECHSMFFERAYKCCVCGEYNHPDDMASAQCCNKCMEENIDEETFKKYLKDQNLETDFYVDWVTESQCDNVSHILLHICKTAFDSMSDEKRMEEIKSFIEDDVDDFASWLEVKKGE